MNAAQPMPPPHWRRRVKNVLRVVKRRVRRARPLPRWRAAGPAQTQLAGERLVMAVETASALHSLLLPGRMPSFATGLDLTVTAWTRPWPGWVGRLGPLPGVTRLEVNLPPGSAGPAAVRVTLAQAAPSTALIAAVLALLTPRRPLPESVSLDIAVPKSAPAWLAADVRHHAAAPAVPSDALAFEDVRLETVLDLGVVVDATTANPVGRGIHDPHRPSATLAFQTHGDRYLWSVSRNGAVLAGGQVGEPLGDNVRSALSRLTAATLDTSVLAPPDQAIAETLAALAMTGLILSAPGLAAGVQDRLAKGLVRFLDSPLPAKDVDPMEWEIRGIAQRREALREHASTFALGRAGRHPTAARPPSVSALLVSRRPHRALQALDELAMQTYPELEIVVVLHGAEPTAEQRSRMLAHGVRLATVSDDNAFGEVLGMATQMAGGSLLTKVDDDDHYGPEHIWDLVLALHYAGADLVGKAAEFVHLEEHDVTVRRRSGSEIYTDVVAGGTMLLARGTLEDVGGWRPVARSVDRALLDRVLRAGGLVYRTHGVGFLYTRHGEGHTWGAGVDYFAADPSRQWAGRPPYAEFGAR